MVVIIQVKPSPGGQKAKESSVRGDYRRALTGFEFNTSRMAAGQETRSCPLAQLFWLSRRVILFDRYNAMNRALLRFTLFTI
jgi:hypothetical protein